MEFRPPPQPHTNGVLNATPTEAHKDPWERPRSTEKLSCGQRPTNRLLYASQPRAPGPDHHQIGYAARYGVRWVHRTPHLVTVNRKPWGGRPQVTEALEQALLVNTTHTCLTPQKLD